MRRYLLTPLVASLFLVAFIESWAALVHAARTAGIPYPDPWPWMVDGFIVAMALMVVEADRTQRSRLVLWPRVGLLAATGLSVWVQVAYAPQGGEWLAAWSPLAVLFSFECLVWLTRPDPIPTPLGKPDPEPAPADPAPDQDQPERTTARSNGSHFTADQRQRIADLVGRKVSAKAIQRELGMSDRAYRDHLLPLVRSLKGELVR